MLNNGEGGGHNRSFSLKKMQSMVKIIFIMCNSVLLCV